MSMASQREDSVDTDIDPFSREFVADPYPFHEALREQGPVVYLRKYGVWSVWRYAQVYSVLNDWKTYCSSAGVGMSNFRKEVNWRKPSLLLETDPPVHDRARSVMIRVLSPPALRRLRQGFYEEAVRLLEPLLERESFDAVEELARPYPLKVFPDAVGIPSEEREILLAYGDMSFNTMGPKNEFYLASMARADEVLPWIAARCQRSVLRPDSLGDDIYKVADCGDITHEEAALLVRSFLSAGLDTTINAIGNAIFCFAQHPDEWSRLRQDPSKVRAAFEEVLRFETPFQGMFRTTTKCIKIDGVQIDEDEKVFVSCSAANRDPRRWLNADRFDIGRNNTGHVGFGTGIHGCVGQMIARLEIETMLTALLERVELIEITGNPEWLLHNVLRAVTKLPVKMRRAN